MNRWEFLGEIVNNFSNYNTNHNHVFVSNNLYCAVVIMSKESCSLFVHCAKDKINEGSFVNLTYDKAMGILKEALN